MKKFLSFLLAGAMLLGMMAGCSSGSSSGNEEAGEKTLFIGGSGPLTGDYATYGLSASRGVQIAADEINAAGGINGYKIILRYEDDQTDPQQAVRAYSKLMDDGMQVSLGAVTSGACVAVTEESQKDGILTLTPSASQKEAAQYDNNFRICFLDPDQGRYSADFIKENNLATKVATLYDRSNDYSVGVHDAFIARAGEIGLEVVDTQAFTNQSNTDFSVQLQSIKNSGAELLFMPFYAQECAYVLTQADGIDLDVIFFGVDGMDGILEKIGTENLALTEGVMLLTPFAADAPDEKTRNFVKKYESEYNMTPDQFAADGYDAIYTIAEAFKYADCDPNDPDFNRKMIDAMTKIEVEGLTGTMTWTADGEAHKTATAVVIVDGAYMAYDAWTELN